MLIPGHDSILQRLLSVAGDTVYASAANVLARLALVANKHLMGNAGGTAPEWVCPYKVVLGTRDMTAASGDVAYTGAGFKPSAVIVFACVEGLTAMSIGMFDGTAGSSIADYSVGGAGANVWTSGGVNQINLVTSAAGTNQQAIWKSWDSDGMTLTWTKNGSPTGDAYLRKMYFR